QIKTKTRKTDKGKKKERKKGGRGTETKYGESWRGKKRTGVKAPLMFSIQNLCKTPVSRTRRSRIVSDGVKGEVFKVFSCICPLYDVPIRKFKTAFHMLSL
uniref:Uncharacterized protein n=1 Tax=Neolamprologus brichardi TaxID=32507 RepID=A0A3Q4H9Z3_NEOBR